MTSAWGRAVCRLLIALAIWTPCQLAQAGLIATDRTVQTLQSERGAVLGYLARSDVAGRLQALGLGPAAAKDRVAVMTDDEVRYLADRIDAVPAGADAAGLLLLIIVIAVIWWAWKR